MAGAALVVISVLLSAPNAVAQSTTVEFNIPAQPVSSALRTYAHQAKVQLLVLTEGLEAIRANAVVGRLDPRTALQMLLAGTGLQAEYRPDATVAVGRGTDTAGPVTSASGDARHGYASWLAQARQEPGEAAQAIVDQNQTSRRTTTYSGEDRRLEEVIVTGTRIKGVKDQFSPVTQFSREEMDLAGFNNVSDVFESLPQNFGGGVTIDTSLADTPDGPGGASVNLRGLGNQATLILLNGHRLAAVGRVGNFVDLSSIPTSAIERVEILTDGASAIYGADAIAGVVNIILRDDFDGAETRLNVGTITDGGGNYLKAGQTLGWSGDYTHAMLTYEYSEEEELDSNQKEFAVNAADPSWLLPFTEKHSVFASTGAQLSDRIRLSADAYFNDRKSNQFTSQVISSLSLLRQIFQVVDLRQSGGALGIDVGLGRDWDANLSGSYARSEFSTHNLDVGGDLVTDAATTVTEILSFDSSIGGPLFNISDNPVKGVIGAHYRSESADLFAIRVAAGDVRIDIDKSRDVFAVFGELYTPIISEGNSMPGIESLAITAAARYESYSDVGSSLVPKVGLSWSPIASLNLRGTYGKSFRAPRVDQLEDHIAFVVLNRFVDPMAPGGESLALLVRGTTADLDPETSTTWTVGFDFVPGSQNGLLLRGTYFHTDFNDQVGIPSLSTDSRHRYTNYTGIPIRDVSLETVQDLCARAAQAQGCLNFADFFPSLGNLSFEDVEVLLDSRFQNLSLSQVAGFDFEVRYDLTSTSGDWRWFLAGTLLTTLEQRTAPAAPINDLLNTFGNPVDWKLRGGMHWRTESVSTALFVNHIGDYIDDEVPIGDVPIDSFTTLDATIRLDLGELWDSPLTEGASLSFSVLNMLNEDPPFISETPHRSAVLDTANANPAGRKIGVSLTKRW